MLCSKIAILLIVVIIAILLIVVIIAIILIVVIIAPICKHQSNTMMYLVICSRS